MSLIDVPTRHKLRELTTAKIGTLIRISGQVVRTHPVHPELILGTFLCVDCNAVIKNVEQQFKVMIITIIKNGSMNFPYKNFFHLCSLQIQQFVIIPYVPTSDDFYWMSIIQYLWTFRKLEFKKLKVNYPVDVFPDL